MKILTKDGATFQKSGKVFLLSFTACTQAFPSKFYKQRSIKLRSDGSVTLLMRTLLTLLRSNPVTLHISHDRLRRPVYHGIFGKFELSDDSDRATPWHKESLPKSSVENENAKVLWNIPIHRDIPPKDGINRPDVVVHHKKGKPFIILEGTVYNIGEIHDRDQRKTEKYMDLRSSLKRMNPGHKIMQLNVVFDFLSGYQKLD